MQSEVDQSEVQRIAYGLWLGEGQPEGRDREHWEMALELWWARRREGSPEGFNRPSKRPRERRHDRGKALELARPF